MSEHAEHRAFLKGLFARAVAAADPALVVGENLPPRPRGRTVVLGAGKAAASMARAVEAAWDGPLEGLVVTRYGHGAACARIEVVEAAHPTPDAAGQAAAQRILASAQALGADDLALCLMSGGASSLLALPARGLTLADKQAVNKALLRSGAPIGEMNVVRKHLSAIKGGRLAVAAHPAQVVTLAISDVPGDDPGVIGSGPTTPDPSTFAQARDILRRYRVTPPPAVSAHLARGAEETPKPGDARFSGHITRVIATAALSLEAAADVARAAGVTPVMLGDALEGEARELARAHAALALEVVKEGGGPCVFLSGGETTVTVTGEGGRGGRNSEYLLALALAVNGHARVYALAADTDGVDGSEANAGAMIDPQTLARVRAAGLDPAVELARHNAYDVFAAAGDLVETGPTLTNVNDFRAVLIV